MSPLVKTFEDDGEPIILAAQMIYKQQLIAKMHGEVTENIYQIQVHKKHAYAIRKWKQMFLALKEGVMYVNMKKLGKKKSAVFSWEGPFLFLIYLDGDGFIEQDEVGEMCVVKGKTEQLWDKPRQDL